MDTFHCNSCCIFNVWKPAFHYSTNRCTKRHGGNASSGTLKCFPVHSVGYVLSTNEARAHLISVFLYFQQFHHHLSFKPSDNYGYNIRIIKSKDLRATAIKFTPNRANLFAIICFAYTLVSVSPSAVTLSLSVPLFSMMP